MKITIYELLGLIKDGKAPKKIKYQNRIFSRVWSDYMGDEPIDEYYVDDDGDNWNVDGFLKLDTEIEIIEEVEDKEYEDIEEVEDKEYEDIEEIGNLLYCENQVESILHRKIDALIRNQKYILGVLNELQRHS